MSATRHCTPNAPEPSLVIRLTTCAAGKEGGIIGAGGGVCATDWIGTVNVARTISPAIPLCISLLPKSRSRHQIVSPVEQQMPRRNPCQICPGTVHRRACHAAL